MPTTATTNSRGSEVLGSVANALRGSLLSELESEKLLAIAAAPDEPAA